MDMEHKSESTESIFKPYRDCIVYYEEITTPTTDEWTQDVDNTITRSLETDLD